MFVIVWCAVFHYETLRLNYLSPLVGRPLPKVKFLYPPAGWIMFFQVDRSYGYAEVYGITGGQPTLIDPHKIFETRAVLYDNIRRNVLVSILSPHVAPRFCHYLRRKFPSYESFAIVQAVYPDVAEKPTEVLRGVTYRCEGHSP